MSMSRGLRNVSAILLIVAAGMTACGFEAKDRAAPATTLAPSWPATDVYVVPDQLRDTTMVWSAEPGIDLFSAEGTLVRAADESAVIAMMVGLKYSYIGFAESSRSTGGGIYQGDFITDTGQGPFVGTVYGHIQQIIPSERGFDAVVCVLSVGVGVLENEKYSPARFANGEGEELRTRFTRAGGAAGATIATQPPVGPQPDEAQWQAPVDDRFIGWEIDGFVDNDPATAGVGRCTQWARSLYPDTTATIERDAMDTPPPVQPAYPGWPDPAS